MKHYIVYTEHTEQQVDAENISNAIIKWLLEHSGGIPTDIVAVTEEFWHQ